MKFGHKVLNDIALLIILMIYLQLNSKDQVFSLLPLLSGLLNSLHENADHLQSTLHVADDDLWYSYQYIPFDQI